MIAKLNEVELQTRMQDVPQWRIENGLLLRRFRTPSFPASIFFVNALAHLAERGQHHPDITIAYQDVSVGFATHSAGGITEKDFAMARKVDELWSTFDWQPGPELVS